MAARTDPTLHELFRERPVQTMLVSGSPLVLAAAQLTNGYVNDVSMLVAVGFAIVMVVYSICVTQYHLAAFRLTKLERAMVSPNAVQ